jgi:hypothetical protein
VIFGCKRNHHVLTDMIVAHMRLWFAARSLIN